MEYLEDARAVEVHHTATRIQPYVRPMTGIVTIAAAGAILDPCAGYHLLSGPRRIIEGQMRWPETDGIHGPDNRKARSLGEIIKIIMEIEIITTKIIMVFETGHDRPIAMVVETDKIFRMVTRILGARILMEIWTTGTEIRFVHIITTFAAEAASTGVPIMMIEFTVKAEV